MPPQTFKILRLEFFGKYPHPTEAFVVKNVASLGSFVEFRRANSEWLAFPPIQSISAES